MGESNVHSLWNIVGGCHILYIMTVISGIFKFELLKRKEKKILSYGFWVQRKRVKGPSQMK